MTSGLFVAGAWRPTIDGRRFTVENPATGHTLAELHDAGPVDADAALSSAKTASTSWAATPPRERARMLRALCGAVLDDEQQLAELMVAESGKSIADALAEVRYAASFLEWFAEEATRIYGRNLSAPDGRTQIAVFHRPVGPTYIVTPWNFPLAMLTRKIGAALAAGCTVVVKPSELTPLTAIRFTELASAVGMPEGVLNLVCSTRAGEVSDALFASPALRKVSFTGSTAVGRLLLRQASDRMVRASMELGGNAPFVVLRSAELDAAIDGAMHAKFRNAGQACVAANRFIVQHSVADEFVERLRERVGKLVVGPPDQAGTDIGPLINRRAVDRVTALVEEAVADGAELVCRADVTHLERGAYVGPTIVRGVQPTHRLFREEIFGPVIAVTEFDDETEGIRLANDTDYGLAAYVYGSDEQLRHTAGQIAAGMIGINTTYLSNAAAPFGEIRLSGQGREGGAEGIHEYLDTIYTATDRS